MSLDLLNSHVGDEGAKAFALNKNIQYLSLRNNCDITNEGAAAFVANTTLLELDIGNIPIDQTILSYINQRLALNKINHKKYMKQTKEHMQNNEQFIADLGLIVNSYLCFENEHELSTRCHYVGNDIIFG